MPLLQATTPRFHPAIGNHVRAFGAEAGAAVAS